MLTLDHLTMTVVYDNNPYAEGLRAEWGFSCFIDGAPKRILFDTGGDAPVLLANMEKLSIDPRDIDIVVLSHEHGDHTGGLRALLEVNPDVEVYLPESFPGGFKQMVSAVGATLVEVGEPLEIMDGVYSLGQMGTLIKEQSLALITDRGVIVITGCAHPGIVSIVRRASEITGGEMLLAMGGFHLIRTEESDIGGIIRDLEEMGLKHAGPCHCSGDVARQLFKAAYEDDYIDIGVGSVIMGSDLR